MFSFLKPRSAPGLTVQQAIAQAAAGTLTVIDVRELAEVKNTCKAAGALHLPLSVFAMKADPRSPERHPALTAGKPVALYCASGGRSGMAAQTMARMGYDQVHNIGGFGDWVAAGGPVER